MFNGIIIVDKPQQFTSHDVIAKLRGILKMKKIGHSGTLDPMATGILPIFLGNATRAVDFHADSQKEYIATFKLGIKTNTDDIWGTVLQTCDISHINDTEVLDVLNNYSGKIMQIPPMFSARKINGQKLYDIARNGGTVTRQPREIEIFEIQELDDSDLDLKEFRFRVLCSKGTYVRTICTDIAEKLGTIATLTSLRRTKSGGFNQGFTIEQIQDLADKNQLENHIIQTESVFETYHRVDVNQVGFTRLMNGTFARIYDCENYPKSLDLSVKVFYNDDFFMLAESKRLGDGDLAIFPVKSFFKG